MEEKKRNLGTTLVRIVAVVMSCYHLYTCIFGIPASQLHRSVHLLFACVLTFACYTINGKKNDGSFRVMDIVMIVISLFSLGYIIFGYKALENRIAFVAPFTTIRLIAFIAIIALIALIAFIAPWVCLQYFSCARCNKFPFTAFIYYIKKIQIHALQTHRENQY